MIIIFFILIFFYLRNCPKFFRKQIVFKAKRLITFDKKNLNNWMNLTKKERYKLSKQESVKYLDKRRLLLDEIRKEYKKVSKGDSKKDIKE